MMMVMIVGPWAIDRPSRAYVSIHQLNNLFLAKVERKVFLDVVRKSPSVVCWPLEAHFLFHPQTKLGGLPVVAQLPTLNRRLFQGRCQVTRWWLNKLLAFRWGQLTRWWYHWLSGRSDGELNGCSCSNSGRAGKASGRSDDGLRWTKRTLRRRCWFPS